MGRHSDNDISSDARRKQRSAIRSATKKAKRFERRAGRKPTPDELRSMRVQTGDPLWRAIGGVLSLAMLVGGIVAIAMGHLVLGVALIVGSVLLGLSAAMGTTAPLESTLDMMAGDALGDVLIGIFDGF